MRCQHSKVVHRMYFLNGGPWAKKGWDPLILYASSLVYCYQQVVVEKSRGAAQNVIPDGNFTLLERTDCGFSLTAPMLVEAVCYKKSKMSFCTWCFGLWKRQQNQAFFIPFQEFSGETKSYVLKFFCTYPVERLHRLSFACNAKAWM